MVCGAISRPPFQRDALACGVECVRVRPLYVPPGSDFHRAHSCCVPSRVAGGRRYTYPTQVWSPAGGWWNNTPPHWQRNTVFAFGGVAVAAVIGFKISAAHEVRCRPLPPRCRLANARAYVCTCINLIGIPCVCAHALRWLTLQRRPSPPVEMALSQVWSKHAGEDDERLAPFDPAKHA